MTTKLTLLIKPGEIISNDHTHEGHDENNPDDGSTSAAALELAVALARQGIEATVERVPE